jgi:hypothetical protein
MSCLSRTGDHVGDVTALHLAGLYDFLPASIGIPVPECIAEMSEMRKAVTLDGRGNNRFCPIMVMQAITDRDET